MTPAKRMAPSDSESDPSRSSTRPESPPATKKRKTTGDRLNEGNNEQEKDYDEEEDENPANPSNGDETGDEEAYGKIEDDYSQTQEDGDPANTEPTIFEDNDKHKEEKKASEKKASLKKNGGSRKKPISKETIVYHSYAHQQHPGSVRSAFRSLWTVAMGRSPAETTGEIWEHLGLASGKKYAQA
ncbi:hypothetical protein K469DRAFT_689875 [Zopfia rhizophila CBS 207.26]|uniref:Uncharacterized protein n=1 Tax=Zopfia rhizophila CBS 207.26 TaxID=1314779 RepID=A0A6A6DZM4_9PEZI|nr:hypothetical protein K469DRAFT_689875 [Zopfia rhizophila CBS 207.26]